MSIPFTSTLLNWAKKLRYPTLFIIIAILFVLDLIIPDVIPFIDEILLGLATIALANWKKRKDPPPAKTIPTP